MRQQRKLITATLAIVFIAAFAIGLVLTTPAPAEACTVHPACPGSGCVATGWKCHNGWYCYVDYCRDGGQVVYVHYCDNLPCP